MKTIVLSNRITKDSKTIENVAMALGYAVHRLTTTNKSEWGMAKELAVYCEGLLAEYVSQNSSMVLLRPLEAALSSAPHSVTKRRVRHIKVSDIPRQEFPTFLKPADQKFFRAGVYEGHDGLSDYIGSYPDDTALVSDVVEFTDEYRHFVLDGVVVATSPYIIDKNYIGDDGRIPPTPADIVSLATEVAQQCKNDIPPSCVIDIGRMKNNELALIAFSPSWTSGIYGCDPYRVFECIQRSCIHRSDMDNALKKFETFDCSN